MSRRLVLDDGRSQRELVLREKMTVGRDAACDISDSDPRLSRKHAEFLATTHGLLVRDLQSRNGIRVNGRTVREASLNPGDLIEIAHLTVRFLDDSTDAVGVPSSASSEASDAAQVREGFEDDRTRVLAAPKLPAMSSMPSGPIDMNRLGVLRDAGDVAISPMDGTVRIAVPQELAPRVRPPRPGLSVQDLMATRWGWRVLGQGALLSGVVFLMVTLPMLHWLTATAGPIGNALLLKMLAAPLLASLFVGLVVASLIARTTARGLEEHDHS
jgi:hypothetical protein